MEYQKLSSFHSPYSLRLKGIVGPMMLGIAAAKLLAHFEVGGLPEVGKVLGELHGFETWREEFHQHRTLASVNTGS